MAADRAPLHGADNQRILRPRRRTTSTNGAGRDARSPAALLDARGINGASLLQGALRKGGTRKVQIETVPAGGQGAYRCGLRCRGACKSMLLGAEVLEMVPRTDLLQVVLVEAP